MFSRALHSTLVLNLSSLQTLAVTLVIAIISERRDTESAGLTVCRRVTLDHVLSPNSAPQLSRIPSQITDLQPDPEATHQSALKTNVRIKSREGRLSLPSHPNGNEYERGPQTRKSYESKSIGRASLRVGFGQNVRGADV